MANTAVRWSGWLLIAGAALLGAAVVLISMNPVVNQPLSQLDSALFLLSSIFLLLSLPAMYARQANSAGWFGLAGYVLLQAGILLLVVIASTPLVYPSLQMAPPQNPVLFYLGIALFLGLLLTGIATIRAGVYPSWAGIALLAAMAGFFFDFFVAEFFPPQAMQIGSVLFGIILALALAWIGLAMWRGYMVKPS